MYLQSLWKQNDYVYYVYVVFYCHDTTYVSPYYPKRRACGHSGMGTRPHQVLAATLTLFQPWVGRLCPPYTVVPTKF